MSSVVVVCRITYTRSTCTLTTCVSEAAAAAIVVAIVAILRRIRLEERATSKASKTTSPKFACSDQIEGSRSSISFSFALSLSLMVDAVVENYRVNLHNTFLEQF